MLTHKTETRHLVRQPSFAVPVLLLLALVFVGCGDSYQPQTAVEGVFEPTVTAPDGSHCVKIEGRRDGWLRFYPTTAPTMCGPIRVSEIGIMTYGYEVRQPGLKLEVARLEFSDASVFIATQHLRATGRFEYRERSATVKDWARNNPYMAYGLAFLGIVVLSSAVMHAQSQAQSRAAMKRRERERSEAEAAANAAERAARAAASAADLVRLMQLMAEARSAADALPIALGEAELFLDRAQSELASRLPSPFWEAIEDTVVKLGEFHIALSTLESRKAAYQSLAARQEQGAPRFAIGVTVLPDPAMTQNRLNLLYREAQAIPHFSIIYEQRRTTATLVSGFRSLGQAIERIGDRIVREVGSVAVSLECGLGSLESALRSSADAAADQGAALHAELRKTVDGSDALRLQLREDSERRSKAEGAALRMLDNIQRRRKPAPFG